MSAQTVKIGSMTFSVAVRTESFWGCLKYDFIALINHRSSFCLEVSLNYCQLQWRIKKDQSCIQGSSSRAAVIEPCLFWCWLSSTRSSCDSSKTSGDRRLCSDVHTEESFCKTSLGYCQYPCGLADMTRAYEKLAHSGLTAGGQAACPNVSQMARAAYMRLSQLLPRCLNSKACVTVRGVKQPANKTDVATALAGAGSLKNMFVSLLCVVFPQWWHLCILLCGCSSVCWWLAWKTLFLNIHHQEHNIFLLLSCCSAYMFLHVIQN